jgi:hypothetical protein
MISTSFSESKMTIILGFGVIVEIVILLEKFKTTSNSFSNYFFLFSY